MAEKESVRRTGDCRIKLAPMMLERLEKMADLYGMPSATLAAFALAEWINQKDNTLQLGRMAVMDIGRKVGGMIEEQLKEAVDSPEFAQMIIQQEGALSQRSLPLDPEAPKAA